MNVASFSLGNLTGKIQVTRTVTALTPGVYKVKANVPGIQVNVAPAALNFKAAGEKKTFKVTFENKSAALGKFAMGSLSWQGAGKTVTSPIAVRPQSAVAAKDIFFTSESGTGSGDINVVSGTDKPIAMTFDGLSKADSSAAELIPGPFAGRADASTFVKTVKVPAGAPLAKFSVISSDPNADFDMWVVTPRGVEQVATASASESLSISNPAAGSYTIYANLYSSPDGKARKASVDAAVLGRQREQCDAEPQPAGAAQRGIRQGHAELDRPSGRLLHRAGHLRRSQRADVRQCSGQRCRRNCCGTRP